MIPPELAPNLQRRLANDHRFRRSLACESHDWFFHLYFPHYARYPTAPFQHEMLRLTQDEAVKLLVILAFRGSAKSTIVSLSYVLWSILGKPQKKFVLLLGQTQPQARQLLKNVKDEVERNELLRRDLVPFREEEDDWRASSIVIPHLGARITAASCESSMRGIRHGPHRPDLIICDDLENTESVRTREGRDKLYQWITGEIIPAGTPDTKMIFIGNLLHEDSLLMRLKLGIEDGILDGTFRKFPLLQDDGACLWPGKFKTPDDVERERRRVGNDVAWYREYLLRLIPTADQVIRPEWIKTYDALPGDNHPDFQFVGTGVDLAIAQGDRADFTAMVSGKVIGCGQQMRIYILPNPINQRLTHLETLSTAVNLAFVNGGGDRYKPMFFVEEVAYQGACVEQLQERGCQAYGMKARNQDKRARLALFSHLVEGGQVLFPKEGTEQLIQQLIHLNTERHDDLADAFAMLLMGIAENALSEVTVALLPIHNSYFRQHGSGW